MGKFDAELDEYEKLSWTELEQFNNAYMSNDPMRAESPIVRDLVARVLEKERQQELFDEHKVENEKEGKMETKEVKEVQEKGLEVAGNGKEMMVERKQEQLSLADTLKMAEVFFKSRLFSELSNVEQAATKILAGRELGLSPMLSLAKVYVVGGKTAIQAEVMAALIKKSGKYDYIVKKHTDSECVIEFFERGRKVGESSFTIKDAERAGVANGVNWKKYPRNMLFARALSNGARWYCPDAIQGAYTYDEIGLEISDEGTPTSAKSTIVIEATPQIENKTDEKKEEQKSEPQKTRKEIIAELKERFGIEKMKEVKAKLGFTAKLEALSDEEFSKFVENLEE